MSARCPTFGIDASFDLLEQTLHFFTFFLCRLSSPLSFSRFEGSAGRAANSARTFSRRAFCSFRIAEISARAASSSAAVGVWAMHGFAASASQSTNAKSIESERPRIREATSNA